MLLLSQKKIQEFSCQLTFYFKCFYVRIICVCFLCCREFVFSFLENIGIVLDQVKLIKIKQISILHIYQTCRIEIVVQDDIEGGVFLFFFFLLVGSFFLLLLIYLITFVIQMERSCNDNEWDFNTNNQQINELYFGGNK
eukprot:TRINITY_DN3905_c0_g1_i4.p6 TRINITY_DN3905_c0_g1~~TRINITY_DN3905_c0_g1_i4.p6  ORF type:complete len:139 (-),score=4.61 TRINITY_DN3905_c0_g1_i4:109-525(-)